MTSLELQDYSEYDTVGPTKTNLYTGYLDVVLVAVGAVATYLPPVVAGKSLRFQPADYMRNILEE